MEKSISTALSNSNKPNRWVVKLGVALAILATSMTLVPIFAFNALHVAPNEMFVNWQLDSDALVSNELVHASQTGSNSFYGLTISPDNTGISGTFSDYVSQIGLQGHLSKFLTVIGINSLQKLQLFNVLLFCVILVCLLIALAKIANRLFAGIFVVTIIFSPWMVSAVKSTYWVPWSWFLPVLIASLFTLSSSRLLRRWLLFSLFVAFVFRFGSGYEFASTFLLAAIFPPFLASIKPNQHGAMRLRAALKEAFQLGFIGLSAFATVFIFHSWIRGTGNLLNGMVTIINEDVLRRTYGDPSLFTNTELQASLQASPLSSLNSYTFGWKTNFLNADFGSPFNLVLNGVAPWALIAISLIVLIKMWWTKEGEALLTTIIFSVALAIPYSWYLLAKSHSIIHTHINFVLWYMFLAAVVLYIPANEVLKLIRRIAKSQGNIGQQPDRAHL